MKFMKYLLLGFLAFACWIACEKATEEIPEDKFGDILTLKVGETVDVEANILSINFEDVVEDSRCAEGADCFWEGQAIVHLLVNASDKIIVIKRDAKEDLAKDTLNNLVYSLLSVLPETNVEKPIAKEDYVIEIQVDKL